MVTIREAIIRLLTVCDGAYMQDGAGFNGVDSGFARDLNTRAIWTSKQESAAHKMLRKYSKQLTGFGITYADLIWEYQPATDATDSRGEVIPVARKRTVEIPAPEKPKSKRGSMLVEFDGKNFIFYSAIDAKDLAKSIPGGKWDGELKAWKYPKNLATVKALMANKSKIKMEDVKAIEACLQVIQKAEEDEVEAKRQEALKNDVIEVKLSDTAEIDVPLNFHLMHKGDMFDHQKKAVKIGITLDNSAFLMEPGTGKTLSALGVIGHRYMKGQVKRVVIIAPKSVVPVWPKEFKHFVNIPHEVHVVEKRSKFKGVPSFTGPLQVLCLTYQSAWETDSKGKVIPWQGITDFKPDLILLDESHNIKNGRSNQAKGIIAAGDKAKFRMILTGTPVSQSPLDFWAQYRFLDASIFGHRYVPFRDEHAIIDQWGGVERLRSGAAEKIAAKAHSIAFRVTKEEAKLNLPKATRVIRYCKLDGETAKLYKQMDADNAIEFSEAEHITAPLVITQLLRLQQIAGGFVKTEGEEGGKIRQVGKQKLDAVEEILDEIPSGKKVVIFARFVPEVHALAELTRKRGMKTEVLTGEVNKIEDRGAMVERFQNGDTDAIIIQLRAGGAGITLTSSSHAIFYSPSFSLLEDEQAQARVDRIGQTEPVTFYYVLAEETVDEDIMEALREKRNIADYVVDKLNLYKSGGKNMGAGKKFIQENPEITKRLEDLKEAIAEGFIPDLTPHTVADAAPEETEQPEESNLQLTIIQGGKELAQVGGKEEKAKKPKTPKSDTPKYEGDVVTVKDLADELGIDPVELRKKLRTSDLQKPAGRWEWPVNHADLAVIRGWK